MLDYYHQNFSFFKRFKELIVHAADPGAFAVLSIFGEFLSERGHVVKYLFDGWAEKCVGSRYPKEARLPVDAFLDSEGTDETGQRTRLLIYGSRNDFAANYRRIEYCKKKKIASLFVFDHWKNGLVNFRDPETGRMYLPEKIAVIDSYHKKLLVEELAPFVCEHFTEKIGIFGQPALDRAVAAMRSIPEEKKADLREKYNPSFRNSVLLILEPFKIDFVRERFPGYDEFDVIEFVFRNCLTQEMRLIIKPHPRHNPRELVDFCSGRFMKSDFDYEIVYDEKIENLIVLCDTVYGMTSIALHAALLYGKNVRSIQIGRNAFGKSLSNPHLEKCLIA